LHFWPRASKQESQEHYRADAAELAALRKQAEDLQRQGKTQESQAVMKQLLEASSRAALWVK